MTINDPIVIAAIIALVCAFVWTIVCAINVIRLLLGKDDEHDSF